MKPDQQDPALDEQLRDSAEDRTAPTISAAESRAEVAAILARRDERKRSQPLRIALVVAVAAILLLAAGVLLQRPAETPAPIAEAPAPPVEPELRVPEVLYEEGPGSHGLSLATEQRLVARVGADRIALAGPSRVAVRSQGPETTLTLEEGLVAAEVASRGDTGQFRVLAGFVTVTVRGTRFAVERTVDATVISVEEGEVHVNLDVPDVARENWSVRAGQQLTIGPRVVRTELEEDGRLALLLRSAPLPEPPPPAPTALAPPPARGPDIDDLRGLLIAGSLDEARAGLEGAVQADPSNTEAWTLLATARRKAGDDAEAVDAWLMVAEQTRGAAMIRARYEAASLMEEAGRLGDALPLLEQIVADVDLPPALEPDARLRLGRILLDQGQPLAGRLQLEEVIQRFPGTGPATAAAALLRTSPI